MAAPKCNRYEETEVTEVLGADAPALIRTVTSKPTAAFDMERAAAKRTEQIKMVLGSL